MKRSGTSIKKRRRYKARKPPAQSKKRIKNQDASGGSKEPLINRYGTCWEDIAEIEIVSIQPCPIIPDYKEPTRSTLPIIVQTPDSSICIDGWNFIEQEKAGGRSNIRCYILLSGRVDQQPSVLRCVPVMVVQTSRGLRCFRSG